MTARFRLAAFAFFLGQYSVLIRQHINWYHDRPSWPLIIGAALTVIVAVWAYCDLGDAS